MIVGVRLAPGAENSKPLCILNWPFLCNKLISKPNGLELFITPDSEDQLAWLGPAVQDGFGHIPKLRAAMTRPSLHVVAILFQEAKLGTLDGGRGVPSSKGGGAPCTSSQSLLQSIL